jgi:hypothetical protein
LVSGNLPPGIVLSSVGNLAGTPSTVGIFDALIQAASPPQTVQQTFRIVVNAGLGITTQSLTDAVLSSAYSVTLAATGGTTPYTWSTSGKLPAGLTLSSAGVISGTPTGVGSYSFPVEVDDSSTPPLQAFRTLSITVAPPLAITTITLPDAFQNLAYSQLFQASGGIAPYTWVLTTGVLPAGLTLASSGLLSGTPTGVESQNITVSLTDSRGTVVTKNFTIAVDPPLSSLSAPGLPSSSNPVQQLPIALQLAQANPGALSGQLTMTFTSKADIPSDDPMTQFSNGTRTVSFTIPANSQSAVFTSPVMLLIGTVTGTIQLTASFQNGPSNVNVASVDVLALPPQVTHAQATLTASGLDLVLTGYSPARRVISMDFDFAFKIGSKIQHVTVSRNVDLLFTAWFSSSGSTAYGSEFSFTQSFIIQGSGFTISSVVVTLKNAQGTTTTSTITPQ